MGYNSALADMMLCFLILTCVHVGQLGMHIMYVRLLASSFAD